MTKKVHFKFYIFENINGKTYECQYDMFIDNHHVRDDSSGLYSTPTYALYKAQQKVVDIIDIFNKIGNVPVEYSYCMGSNF